MRYAIQDKRTFFGCLRNGGALQRPYAEHFYRMNL